VTKEEAEQIVKKINSHSAAPNKSTQTIWQQDAQREEAFKLTANLIEQGYYKPGAANSELIESSVAKLQDLFPGASRWTGAPRLNSQTAMGHFKDFAKSGGRSSIEGFNEVLDTTLKKLTSKHGANYTKAQALEALGETIKDYKHLSAKEQGELLSCVRNLVAND
jgi:hypothetical protein